MKRRLMTIALAAAMVAGAGWWVTGQSSTPTLQGQPIALPGAANAQESAVEVVVQEMMIGAEDAPVEVIEYASYTCPHCATFHQTVFKDLKADYIDTGKVKFTYREVYFDRYGLWGSMIARCGGGEDRFFGITGMLYEQQSTWARAGSEAAIADELRKIGRIAGLENDQLEACLSNGDQARALIEWYQANAEADGITSTPSFVIDGTTYSNMSYNEFKGILDEQLGG